MVDGNDFEAVLAAVRQARTRAVTGEGATLIECKTYRLSGHSRGDPRVYRTRDEERAWQERDPIARYARSLEARGILAADEAAKLHDACQREIDEAVRFAEQSPDPDPALLAQGVFM